MLKAILLAAAMAGTEPNAVQIERKIVHPDGTVETIYATPAGKRFEIQRPDGRRIGIEESSDRRPRRKL